MSIIKIPSQPNGDLNSSVEFSIDKTLYDHTPVKSNLKSPKNQLPNKLLNSSLVLDREEEEARLMIDDEMETLGSNKEIRSLKIELSKDRTLSKEGGHV